MAETKLCERCGQPFTRSPKGDAYHFRHRRFCGSSCAATATSARRRPFADRFWEKVEKPTAPEACWRWLGGHATAGYGMIGVDAWTRTYAHRASYTLHFGDIPPGMEVCHHCDNRECTNPDHLFLGTHADNMRDMWGKGRAKTPGLRGEGHHQAKLTEAAVREIRASGEPAKVIAGRLSVTPETIYMIRSRRTWRHLA